MIALAVVVRHHHPPIGHDRHGDRVLELARTLAPATYLTHEPTLGIHNIDLLGLVVLVENQQVARRVKCDALNIPELLPFLAGKRA